MNSLRTVKLLSSYSISMLVNPSMTLCPTAALVFICAAALASLDAQEAPSGRSEAVEFQKLDPALKFLRARSARAMRSPPPTESTKQTMSRSASTAPSTKTAYCSFKTVI